MDALPSGTVSSWVLSALAFLVAVISGMFDWVKKKNGTTEYHAGVHLPRLTGWGYLLITLAALIFGVSAWSSYKSATESDGDKKHLAAQLADFKKKLEESEQRQDEGKPLESIEFFISFSERHDNGGSGGKIHGHVAEDMLNSGASGPVLPLDSLKASLARGGQWPGFRVESLGKQLCSLPPDDPPLSASMEILVAARMGVLVELSSRPCRVKAFAQFFKPWNSQEQRFDLAQLDWHEQVDARGLTFFGTVSREFLKKNDLEDGFVQATQQIVARPSVTFTLSYPASFPGFSEIAPGARDIIGLLPPEIEVQTTSFLPGSEYSNGTVFTKSFRVTNDVLVHREFAGGNVEFIFQYTEWVPIQRSPAPASVH